MEGAMLYRKFPAYNSNVSSAIPSDNLVRSVRSFTIPITTNFGLFSQMLKVTLETFLMRRDATKKPLTLRCVHRHQDGDRYQSVDDVKFLKLAENSRP